MKGCYQAIPATPGLGRLDQRDMTFWGIIYSKSLSAGWANVVATAAGTSLLRAQPRWVWTKTGRRSLVGEILPFFTLSSASPHLHRGSEHGGRVCRPGPAWATRWSP